MNKQNLHTRLMVVGSKSTKPPYAEWGPYGGVEVG